VLGFSKSATDIAVNAVHSGATTVTIVYRRPVWRIPYFLAGLVNFKHVLYIRAQEQMFRTWERNRALRFVHTLAKPIVWLHWRMLETLLNIQLQLRKNGLMPRTRIEDDINCAIPIVTPGFYDMVAAGRIKAIQGSFSCYKRGEIVLTGGGGVSVPADIAVLATGWKLGVPFLPPECQAQLVEPDGQYRLYRLIVNPDIPALGFVGFNNSFCTVLCAELAANWLVRYADGQLARQPSREEMQQNIAAMLAWKRNERPAAGVYGGLCVAPYHFKQFDELLADIGATQRRGHLLAETLLPPDADCYGAFLRSAPGYSVG
jgi:dimethylaniline monooxygenase (N-oxide forming)